MAAERVGVIRVLVCFAEFRCGSWVGESNSCRRRSCSSRDPAGVIASPRQPREARSSTAHTRLRQLASPGSRPMTFTRRRVSPKVRSMKLECRIRLMVLDGQAQIAGQLRSVREQTPDRRRESRLVGLGEDVDALLHGINQFRPGADAGGQQLFSVKNRPERILDLRLRGDGHLRQHIATSVDETFLPSERAKTASMPLTSPAAPSGMTSNGSAAQLVSPAIQPTTRRWIQPHRVPARQTLACPRW